MVEANYQTRRISFTCEYTFLFTGLRGHDEHQLSRIQTEYETGRVER